MSMALEILLTVSLTRTEVTCELLSVVAIALAETPETANE